MNSDQKNLTRRYLVWCYKTTKDELDKIDRYFTQDPIDHIIVKHLKSVSSYKGDDVYKEKVETFETYMTTKLEKAQSKKFDNVDNEEMNAEYVYLKNRLEGIDLAIQELLGEEDVKIIHDLYEEEMTRRILVSTGH